MKGYVFVKKQFWVTKLTWRFFLIKNKVFFRIRVPSFRQIIESRMVKFKFGTLEQNDAVRFTVWSSASVNVHGSYGEVIAMPLQKLWNKPKLVPYKEAVYLGPTTVSNHRTTLDPWNSQKRCAFCVFFKEWVSLPSNFSIAEFLDLGVLDGASVTIF